MKFLCFRYEGFVEAFNSLADKHGVKVSEDILGDMILASEFICEHVDLPIKKAIKWADPPRRVKDTLQYM